LALVKKYNDWKAHTGVQKGQTLNVNQLLKILSPTKINAWDYTITGVYPKKSTNYVTLLPNGHKPFQKGDKLSRISAVTQLKTNLTLINNTALATTLTDVTNFEGQLTTANNTQTGALGATSLYSADVEKVITDAMNELFGILGDCIKHFKAEPTLTEPYFDLATIRNHEQVIFNSSLHSSEHETLVEHKFAETDVISVSVDGATDVGVYLAAQNGDGPANYTVIKVSASSEKDIEISEFTNNTTNRFLSVVNLSDVADGHVSVDIA
jgi:hypothetical protein